MTPHSIPKRVLVIDDDPMARDLLAILLHAEGYAVECAESGDAALADLRQSGHTPDLVLADVQMPGTSGAELAEALRRACSPMTRLLAMSGNRPCDEAIARFDGFLLKPFSMEQIAAALAARNRPVEASAASTARERWVVVTGPAGRSPSSRSGLIAIQAASAPQTASKRGMKSPADKAASADPVSRNPSGEPVLDEEIYRRLAASMSAPQLQEMYAMCLKDTRKRIAAMRRLAATHSGADFAREAHAIKGSCGMLGATELQGLAAKLEASDLGVGGAAEMQEVNSLDELAAACDRLERILRSAI